MDGSCLLACSSVYLSVSDATWQWKDDNGSFHTYNDECQDLLEDAYRSGKPSLDLAVCKRCYTVDLVAMSQIRKGYGTQRTVMRKPWSEIITPIAYAVDIVYYI